MTSTSTLQELRLWLGIERNTTSHGEKWISGIGALMGILCVYWITRWVFPQGFTGTPGGVVMLTSMGASAVLLFAVPHGALSQPWAVVGGHLISATIGVTCQQLFPDHAWTAALAVGLAVGAMHYLRCIHPPGGATALAAVIGGAEVHALGYHYLLAPVLINVAAILLMGLFFMWAGATVDPDSNCDASGRECAPWLVPIAFWMGAVATSMGLGMLAFNRKWGSRLDIPQRCLFWWDSVMSAETHRLALDDITRIKVQHRSESTDRIFFYGKDGARVRFTEERVVPYCSEQWARDLATHFPHITIEVEES